jgi:hypothetical protein
MFRILEMVVFHLPCQQDVSLRPPEEGNTPGTNGCFDLEEGLVFLASQGEVLECTIKHSEVQESGSGALPIRLVRTQVQILGIPLRAEGELDHLPGLLE